MPKTRKESEHAQQGSTTFEVQVRLDDFGARALREEAARQGVPVSELAAYAVMYYLADLDSGRITRDVPPLARRS